MENRRRVMVCGSSLNMAGITASLKSGTDLSVFCVNPDSTTSNHNLEENDLMAIVFDLSDPTLKLDLSVLRSQTGLLLIGVDPSNDEMLVLSSHHKQSLSMADLIDVIHEKVTKSPTK